MKKDFGKKGEDTACEYLKVKGYEILERNFQTKRGEIDIIAQEADTLVFIEVKARHSRTFGLPEESVRGAKLRTIERIGQFFRQTHRDLPEAERIDVVAIEFAGDKVDRVELIKNATG